LHIAFFTNFYLPYVSGVVRSVETFRKALTRQGHNVFIFAQQDADYEDQVPFIFRYPSLDLPLKVDVPAVIPVSPFVDQLLPSLKLDVIHTHHPVLLGQAAASKARELDLPLVFTFHSQYQVYTHYIPLPQDVVQNFLKNALRNWLRDFMGRCQHIVIPSPSMKEILIRDYSLKDHYTVIPTGIDLRPYQYADGNAVRALNRWQDDIVLISIGRLAPEKNWKTLIRAAAIIHHEFPKLRLVLIGDGPEKVTLQQLTRELGIADRITFTGKLPFTEVPSHLKAANLFGFASTNETQGLVTMEAMAAGLPVVAVDGSGTRDIIINGRDGFLVSNDPQELAACVKRLLTSPGLMENLRDHALAKAKTFDVDNLTKELIKVYEQAIQDKKDGQHVSVA
jgi:1,2-diacylglycerol 3-alpha-glucosyltransferase